MRTGTGGIVDVMLDLLSRPSGTVGNTPSSENTGTSTLVPQIESQPIQNREPVRLEILNRMARDVEPKCESL